MATRKILLIIVGLYLGWINTEAQLRVGVKGGVECYNMSTKELKENFEGENLHGFQLGPTIELNVPILNVGLTTSVLYLQHNFSVLELNADSIKEKFDFRTGTLEIPFALKYSLTPLLESAVGADIFVVAGVYTDMDLKDIQINFKSLGVGLNVGLGVEIFKHVQLGMHYKHDLQSIKRVFTWESGEEVCTILNTRLWTLCVAFLI